LWLIKWKQIAKIKSAKTRTAAACGALAAINNIMRKLFSVIFILCIFSPIYGQVKIGVFGQPNWSFSGDNTWFNNSVGIKTNIHLYKSLFLNIGIGYAPEIYDNLGDPIDRLFADILYNHLIQNEFQIRCDFVKAKQYFAFYGLIGSSFSTSIYRKTEYSSPPYETNTSQELRFDKIALEAGLGFEFLIKRFSIIIEPTYFYTVWDNGALLYSNRFGISIGMFYKI